MARPSSIRISSARTKLFDASVLISGIGASTNALPSWLGVCHESPLTP